MFEPVKLRTKAIEAFQLAKQGIRSQKPTKLL